MKLYNIYFTGGDWYSDEQCATIEALSRNDAEIKFYEQFWSSLTITGIYKA